MGDSTKGMGMIGQRDAGRLPGTRRQPHAGQAQRQEQGLGQGQLARRRQCVVARGLSTGGVTNLSRPSSKDLRTSGVGTTLGTGTAAGTLASSLAFTATRGLELVDPKVQAELRPQRKRQMKIGGLRSGSFHAGWGGRRRRPAVTTASKARPAAKQEARHGLSEP